MAKPTAPVDTAEAAKDAAASAITGAAARRLDYVRLDELKADPRNPKSHSLETIGDSLDRFGMVDLISVDGRTGFIISGHGRTTALKELAARDGDRPEGVEVDTDGTWLIPVNAGWSSKNEAEAAAALIALNRTTEMGGWVDDNLFELLELISNDTSDFSGVGFDEGDMDDLRAQLDEQAAYDERELAEAAGRLRAAGADGEELVDAHGNPIDEDGNRLDGEAPAGSDGPAAGGDAPASAGMYTDQGRRLVVLDYSVDEFAEVAPRLKQLRGQLGVDNNAEAVRTHLLTLIPELDGAAPAAADAADSTDYAEVEVSTKRDGEEG